MNDKAYSTDKFKTDFNCVLIDPAGNEIDLDKPNGTSTFSMARREGVSIYNFTIEKPGRYNFKINESNPANKDEFVLTIGQDFSRELLTKVIQTFGSILVSILIAIIIIAIVNSKRKKNKREMHGRDNE